MKRAKVKNLEELRRAWSRRVFDPSQFPGSEFTFQDLGFGNDEYWRHIEEESGRVLSCSEEWFSDDGDS